MLIFFAVTCELLSITFVITLLHEVTIPKSRLWIWGLILFLTALNAELGLIRIPVLLQYAIFVIWTMLSFKSANLLQCCYEALIAYAALIFFQINALLFFPPDMPTTQYELSCFLADLIALLFSLLQVI